MEQFVAFNKCMHHSVVWLLFLNLRFVFIERYSLAVSKKLLTHTFWIRLNLSRGQTLLFHHIWNKQHFRWSIWRVCMFAFIFKQPWVKIRPHRLGCNRGILKVGFSCSLMALELFLWPKMIRRQKMVAWRHFEFIFVPAFEHRCIIGSSQYNSVWKFREVSQSIELFSEIANVPSCDMIFSCVARPRFKMAVSEWVVVWKGKVDQFSTSVR